MSEEDIDKVIMAIIIELGIMLIILLFMMAG